MTREQWLRDQIRSLEDTIAKQRVGHQARIAFFQAALERQQEALDQWCSPNPEDYSPEMVRCDIAATEARLKALERQPPSPDRDSDIDYAEAMLAEHRELLANLEAVVSGERTPAKIY